jgi:membrane-associated protein
MLDALNRITDLMQGMVGSPWLWLIVFVVAALDALLPFMPSDTTMIIVGVLVAPDSRMLLLLIAIGMVGALAGDCLGYLIGRHGGTLVIPRLTRDEAGQRKYQWALAQLRRHGSLLIMIGRYIPGGRVTTMLGAGALHYPVRRFMITELIATAVWSAYCALIGFAGGASFREHPAVGMLLAVGAGVVLMGVLEVVRRIVTRRRPRNRHEYAMPVSR